MTHPSYVCWGPLRLCTSPSAALLYIINRQLSKQGAKHMRTLDRTKVFTVLLSTGQPEDPRLPWEPAPGPSLQPKLSSSRPWWQQLTVSPVPSRFLFSRIVFSGWLYSSAEPLRGQALPGVGTVLHSGSCWRASRPVHWLAVCVHIDVSMYTLCSGSCLATLWAPVPTEKQHS